MHGEKSFQKVENRKKNTLINESEIGLGVPFPQRGSNAKRGPKSPTNCIE